MLIVFSCLMVAISANSRELEVIYGADDRYEVDNYPDKKFIDYSASTVAIIKKSLMRDMGDDIAIKGQRQSTPLCYEERFATQVVAAHCSGFLIAPDIIVTAGHCMKSASDCHSSSMVFGYDLKTANGPLFSVSKKEVYNCQKVLLQSYQRGRGADYAVIKLDRPVPNHPPLPIRKSGKVSDDEKLVVIGHPMGLPLKITDQAIIRDNSVTPYFVTNADTYGGNSGSVVIGEKSDVVEGILVRGEEDFVYDQRGWCKISKVCKEDECRGEDVMRITEIPGLDTFL